MTQAGRLPVILAEPKPLLRAWLTQLVETDARLALAGETGDAEEVERLSVGRSARLVVLGQSVGAAAMLRVGEALRRHNGFASLAVFAVQPLDRDISIALRAGAAGYVTATETRESLAEGLRRLARGERYFSSDAAARLAQADGAAAGPIAEVKPKLDLLTPREIQVLTCIAKGMSKKQIASELGRAHKTIDNHSTNLMNKLDIHDRVELTLFAIREGLADA